VKNCLVPDYHYKLPKSKDLDKVQKRTGGGAFLHTALNIRLLFIFLEVFVSP
jgi:hypothetical protein